MKKALTITAVLSWVNLVFNGIFTLLFLIWWAMTHNSAMLIIIVLTGGVILHSYASLQLRKNILHPEIPFNRQTTPVGIRIMGFLALFFGLMLVSQAIYNLQHTAELLKNMPEMPELKNLDRTAILRASGIFTLILGAAISVNVFLNFRILRWYILSLEDGANQ